MKKILAITLLAGIVVACNKDKFQTKPQLEIKEQPQDTIPANSTSAASIILEWTDKEGDVNDTLFVVRERVNANGWASLPFNFPLPTFPGATQGEIQIDFFYNADPVSGSALTSLTAGNTAIGIPGTGNPSKKEVDTLHLKFVLQDKQKNKSDTAVAVVYVKRT